MVDVDVHRKGVTYENVLVPSRFRFETRCPQQDDEVTIQQTDRGTWILRDVLSVDMEKFQVTKDGEEKGELTGEGEFAIRFDENTRIEARRRTDGSGKFDLILEASGDILIDREGIEEPVPVARADHTHQFSYDGGGQDSSTLSGETDEVESKP